MSGNGNSVVIGSPYGSLNNLTPGKVSVFNYLDSSWIKSDSFYGESNNDLFGWSAAISDDSKTIVVGAKNNSDNALFSGHARVFRDNSDCLGCTDPSSINYDPNATADDGSCIICIYGCIVPSACNYDPNATCDDGSCSGLFGCMDPLAVNYNVSATCDDGSCQYNMVCNAPKPNGLYAFDITDNRAKIGWNNMNDSACMVLKYYVRYRELGSNTWTTKSAGAGNGLCNSGINNITKQLINLFPSTTYEFKMKAFYCGGMSSNYSQAVQFTTKGICPNIINLSVQTFNNNFGRAKFTWDTTGSYVFARVLLRVDTTGSSWQTAGGFGIYYPALFINKYGLQHGQSYRGVARTFCDSSITSYRSPTWTNPIFWTQPGTIRINGASSIDNLTIYPNPSRDIFNISFISESIQRLDIRIINQLGEIIFDDIHEKFVGEYTKSVNLKNYAKGVYFLEIITDGGVVNKKLVLN